ncbi:MAG: DUF4136 domain-containing protein [Xanthomonadales bacterium]|nr:DUF4136 domain-containing protein [Xanthomonadales bacterium]
MNRFLGTFSLLISFALLTACASDSRVQSKRDINLNISRYQSYNFSSRTEIENPDLPATLELYFSAAVEQKMLSRGFVRSDMPDILINVSVDVEDVSAPPTKGLNCPRYDDFFGRRVADSYAGEGRRPMCMYTEGSIEVEMVNEELITLFKGVSRVRMDENDRGDSLARSVQGDVGVMFGDRSRVPVVGLWPASGPVSGVGGSY